MIANQLVMLNETIFTLTLTMISSEIHLVLYLVCFNFGIYACVLCLGAFLIPTYLIFHAFDRVNHRLVRFTGQCGSHRVGSLYRFTSGHTRLFRASMNVSRFIGKLYFVFILISFPVNALLVMTLLLGRFRWNFLIFVLTLTVVPTAAQHFCHVLMVRYNRKIHWHSKPLLNLSASRAIEGLRAQLHLDHYVARFHTTNQYGITNGPLGVVTNKSATKVKQLEL